MISPIHFICVFTILSIVLTANLTYGASVNLKNSGALKYNMNTHVINGKHENQYGPSNQLSAEKVHINKRQYPAKGISRGKREYSTEGILLGKRAFASEGILIGKRRYPTEGILLGKRQYPIEGILLGKRNLRFPDSKAFETDNIHFDD
ncbi:unnamed protein product [Rotaria socialis]|uniref:Uncharacterized protein n=1 Tax=Rotaria socialis TaxID=392032 RepID=A0A820RRW6_9BILA|nr:unnamed protein product [Rotaria socialis]CAF3203796.1 unnamed protein product [Rotaria socialis]CAF3591925.1 unnamed protein product [Rotaria socialis]CAF4246577.1 unnamed protein product [Rotaria socialis]CAF4374639.1 unnamed protein product [Rotaria socialis]